MPAEFQKAMHRTINHAKNTFWFLDEIFIESRGSETEHEKLVETVLKIRWQKSGFKDFEKRILQKPGGLVRTSPLGIRNQSKVYWNRSDTKSKPTKNTQAKKIISW